MADMRVLVVEDDPKMQALLRQGLEENGFSVDLASTGEEALSTAAFTEHDAILLDVMLPGVDGLAVCRRLRSSGSAVPILMLTARGSVGDRVRGLDEGADDYLAKPFDFDELLARLRAITRRPATRPQTVLQAADLELDPATHEVRRAGRSIELTSREFALLEYFLRRKEYVVTQSMILDHVWGLDYGGASNLVPVYINRLRRKIEDGFEPKLIHTLRGTGYVLRDD